MTNGIIKCKTDFIPKNPKWAKYYRSEQITAVLKEKMKRREKVDRYRCSSSITSASLKHVSFHQKVHEKIDKKVQARGLRPENGYDLVLQLCGPYSIHKRMGLPFVSDNF